MLGKKTVLSALLAAGIGTMGISSALAAVSAEEAKALGTTLTEFGAEKAGNADGSIPAYTGGLSMKDVPGYNPKTDANPPDPYKNEKPLYSIDAKNMAQYDAVLTAGTKGLLKQYPGYRVDVYPTHRTMRYPAWVLQNTLKNATTAKLGGAVEGDDLQGADAKGYPYAGIPFPIPKTGVEAMWNNTMRYAPAVGHNVDAGYLIDTNGNITNLPGVDENMVHPWYDKAGKLREQTADALFGFNANLTSPPTSAGIVFLNFYMPNSTNGGQRVWFYTPGQRRVRMAPEFAYDVPIASYGGMIFWDEIFGFVGRLDRFDFKLAGKKETLIPYNVFGTTGLSMRMKDVIGPKYINPSSLRWEKHRVWVVEATRKAGARHIYSKRTFFVDEDSWLIALFESYDNLGNLYRVSQTNSWPAYDTGGLDNLSWTTYDVIKGNYFIVNTAHSEPGNSVHNYDSSEGLDLRLTAQSVAASGVR